MKKSDHIIDIGPNAGKNGGEIIFEGTFSKMLKKNTVTSQFLNGNKVISEM